VRQPNVLSYSFKHANDIGFDRDVGGHGHSFPAAGLDLRHECQRCASVSLVVHANGVSTFGGEAGSGGANTSAGSGD